MSNRAVQSALAKISTVIGKVAPKIYPDDCFINPVVSSVDVRGGVEESFLTRTQNYLIPCSVEGKGQKFGGEITAGERVQFIERYTVTMPAKYLGVAVIVNNSDRLSVVARDTQVAKTLEIEAIDRTDGIEIVCECIRVWE